MAKMRIFHGTTHEEVRKYLEDSDNNLKSLKGIPIIESLFVKYTPL